MATNPTSDKVSNRGAATETEPKPSAFSRLFNRNGHEKKTPPPAPMKGPAKTVAREYFESAVVTVVMALFGMTFIVQAVKVPTGQENRYRSCRSAKSAAATSLSSSIRAIHAILRATSVLTTGRFLQTT